LKLRSQLLKGVLEGCILAIIKQGPTYGYGLSMKLNENGLTDISEGSIYPILLRLQKEGLIEGKMKASPTGPQRKYYYLTTEGTEALQMFHVHWEALKGPVDNIIKGGNH